jgi:hypothetical protein
MPADSRLMPGRGSLADNSGPDSHHATFNGHGAMVSASSCSRRRFHTILPLT